MLLHFLHYLYRDSSDSLSVDSINVGYDNDETYKLLNCNIEACFGNDWVGRYLHGKVRTTFSNEMFLKQRDSSLTESLHLNMCPITNELIVFDDNGNCLSRDLLENSLIFGLNVKNPKIDSFLNTCITNPTQLLSTVGLMCCLSGIIIEPKVVDNIDNDGIFRGKFLEAQSEIIKKQSKIAELEKELDLVRRSSLFKVKNLEHSLSASLETSERLSNEIKDLKATISSITEERVSSYSEPEIIIEPLEVNKLAFLNDYKILIVGGRMDLAKVLNDFGWTNIIQVDNIQNLSGSIPSIDFICFNTAFLSHSLFDSVRSKYSNMFDRMYYFNGTNKSALVDTSYSFVKNYLDL